jgi:hypothetical protein
LTIAWFWCVGAVVDSVIGQNLYPSAQLCARAGAAVLLMHATMLVPALPALLQSPDRLRAFATWQVVQP